MAIALEKILPIEAKDWCLLQGGKSLRSYNGVGVHYFTSKKEDLAKGLAENVPEDAVIVTDYKFSNSISISTDDEQYWGQATGVALIPKNEDKSLMN